MELSTVTLNPPESTLYTRKESLHETTWSSELPTEPPLDSKRQYSYIYISLLICLLGALGNGLLIAFLTFCVKRKPLTVYILNLAIADSMVLLCTFAFQLMNILYYHLSDDTFLNYVIFLMVFGYNTGLHLLTAISVERCLCVLYPLWYHCQRPKHQSAIACVLLWALSVLVSGLESFFCILKIEPTLPKCQYVYTFSCIVAFVIFAPLLVFSNLILFLQVCCNLKPRQPTKLYIIIMVTVVLFLVFAMPMKVVLILVYSCGPGADYVGRFFPYLYTMSTINCSVNPIVYFVVGSVRRERSRKSLKETLQKVFEEKPVPDLGGNATQLTPDSASPTRMS
ncbi:mas-related G-protein coupled receptor member H [Tupaia chinensis]|uniref:Mas-related G-protein coupled receptor member H n=1 Tax=Tupaia chinensis TaxID=246437 RepID=L9KPZ9_TUPCH|nr:mas-related G-protein coupled receptor member H [Tupaia chinensis]ELW63262.1 Mas-related G-protein coupled receptor member H [Tupaia chinensis]